MGKDEGADLVLDGRGYALQGYEKGFFIGPTFFDRVKPEMRTYREEIFGPVLQMVRAPDFETRLRCLRPTSTETASPSSRGTAAPRATSPRA